MPNRFRPVIYAIDFGTSNSLLAAASAEQAHPPVPLDPGANDPTILRSILYFPHAARCHYGQDAIREYVAQGLHGRLIRSIKKHLPSRSFVGTHIDERPMTIEDLVGVLLREMKVRADRLFGADVGRGMLGRPASFSANPGDDRLAQDRLERAAKRAGFREVFFCPEPIAAAREFRTQLDRTRVVLVADLGGGTSDFTVVRIGREGFAPSDVLAVGGISVAGDALDATLMRHRVSRHFGADVTYQVPMSRNVLRMPPHPMEKLCTPAGATLLRSQDVQTFLRNVQSWSLGPEDAGKIDRLLTFVDDALGFSVFESIERAKRDLSDAEETLLTFEYPTIDIREHITRASFDEGSAGKTEAILAKLDEVVRLAGLEHRDIDVVCATGGTAKIPRIATALRERFGAERLQEFQHFHSVVHGLAEEARAAVAA